MKHRGRRFSLVVSMVLILQIFAITILAQPLSPKKNTGKETKVEERRESGEGRKPVSGESVKKESKTTTAAKDTEKSTEETRASRKPTEEATKPTTKKPGEETTKPTTKKPTEPTTEPMTEETIPDFKKPEVKRDGKVRRITEEDAPLEKRFPASYLPALRKLQKMHPNWHFVAYHTGLDWDEVFAPSAEMELANNIVELGAKPSSWQSTTIAGAFSWTENRWVILSSPNWVQASEEAVRYCMDPRNFLTEEQVFQFEQMSFAPYHTVEGTDVILKGTFMHSSRGPVPGTKKTYAEVFYEVGKKIGASPYVLASRVRQEQGVNGTSPLISGLHEFRSPKTGKMIHSYYNYFNMSASGRTREEIVNNGLLEAYEEEWNTRLKALMGGSVKFANRYILSREQDTLYLQKFNVTDVLTSKGYTYRYWAQYMQNLLAPYDEAKGVYRGYKNLNALNKPFTFLIPVYNHMPEHNSPAPTKDGNPNYKLSSILVNDEVVPGFYMDKKDYEITVYSDSDAIRLRAFPFASTTKVNGSLGIYDKVLHLKIGSHMIKILSVAENGDAAEYSVKITRKKPVYSNDEGSFEWGSGFIRKIPRGTTAGAFMNATSTVSEIVHSNGDPVGADEVLGTGMRILRKNGKSYIVRIFGDVNGDGQISLVDYINVGWHCTGYKDLSGSYAASADVNRDGKVTLMDYIMIGWHCTGYRDLPLE